MLLCCHSLGFNRESTMQGSVTPTLRITGYRSQDELVKAIASHLVGVVHIVEITGGSVLVAVDNGHSQVGEDDLENICALIKDSLAYAGVVAIDVAQVRSPSVPPNASD